MDLTLSAEQEALRELARDLFEQESPPSRLRALWEGAALERRVWDAIAKAGIAGLVVPEAYGGAGGDDVDLVVVLEEAGRAALPEPLLECAVAARAIAARGDGRLKEEWLTKIANGDAIVVAASEGLAPLGGVDGVVFDDGRAAIVASPPSLDTSRVDIEDRARPLFRVGPPAGSGPSDDRGVVGAAATLNGVASRLLDMSVEHAKTRHQFGRPIGSFQAVKHQLADVYIALECSRSATYYAAAALTAGAPGSSEAARVAKIAASDTEALANRVALQVHGGIGFTWEHDLHFWLKRGNVVRYEWGSAGEHRAALARSRYGSVS